MQQENNSSTLNSGSLQKSSREGWPSNWHYTQRNDLKYLISKNDKDLANHMQRCFYFIEDMSHYETGQEARGMFYVDLC